MERLTRKLIGVGYFNAAAICAVLVAIAGHSADSATIARANGWGPPVIAEEPITTYWASGGAGAGESGASDAHAEDETATIVIVTANAFRHRLPPGKPQRRVSATIVDLESKESHRP